MSHDKPDAGLRRHSKFGTVNCRPKGWKNYVEGMPPVHSFLNVKYVIPVSVFLHSISCKLKQTESVVSVSFFILHQINVTEGRLRC